MRKLRLPGEGVVTCPNLGALGFRKGEEEVKKKLTFLSSLTLAPSLPGLVKKQLPGEGVKGDLSHLAGG